jgi:hypothetical protein
MQALSKWKFNLNKSLIYLLLYPSVFLIIFNPYTIYGKPGIIVSLMLVLYGFIASVYKFHLIDNLINFSFLAFAGFFGTLVSFINGIGQFNHAMVVISLIIMWLISQVVYHLCYMYGIKFDEYLKIILNCILANYIVILMEVKYLEFRSSIESFLAPAGNIDWEQGFRYRGLAASGGAGLSILLPIAVTITVYLLKIKKINVVLAATSIFISLTANVFIGRTGLLLLGIVIVTTVIYYSKQIVNKTSSTFLIIFFMLIVGIVVFLFYDTFRVFLENRFGLGFIKYAFGFIFEGKAGLESEGTVGIIAEYIKIVPTEFPEVLTGFGYYGGSDFFPYTDSGYPRLLLSIGWPLGILFYVGILILFFKKFWIEPFLIVTLGLILLVAEVKQPLLFSGYAARIYIFIIVFLRKQYR